MAAQNHQAALTLPSLVIDMVFMPSLLLLPSSLPIKAHAFVVGLAIGSIRFGLLYRACKFTHGQFSVVNFFSAQLGATLLSTGALMVLWLALALFVAPDHSAILFPVVHNASKQFALNIFVVALIFFGRGARADRVALLATLTGFAKAWLAIRNGAVAALEFGQASASFISQAWTALVNAFNSIITYVTHLAVQLEQAITALPGKIVDGFYSLARFIHSTCLRITAAFNRLQAFFARRYRNAKDAIFAVGRWFQAVASSIHRFGQRILGYIQQAWDFGCFLVVSYAALMDRIETRLVAAAHSILGIVKTVYNFALGRLNAAWQFIQRVYTSVKGFLQRVYLSVKRSLQLAYASVKHAIWSAALAVYAFAVDCLTSAWAFAKRVGGTIKRVLDAAAVSVGDFMARNANAAWQAIIRVKNLVFRTSGRFKRFITRLLSPPARFIYRHRCTASLFCWTWICHLTSFCVNIASIACTWLSTLPGRGILALGRILTSINQWLGRQHQRIKQFGAFLMGQVKQAIAAVSTMLWTQVKRLGFAIGRRLSCMALAVYAHVLATLQRLVNRCGQLVHSASRSVVHFFINVKYFVLNARPLSVKFGRDVFYGLKSAFAETKRIYRDILAIQRQAQGMITQQLSTPIGPAFIPTPEEPSSDDSAQEERPPIESESIILKAVILEHFPESSHLEQQIVAEEPSVTGEHVYIPEQSIVAQQELTEHPALYDLPAEQDVVVKTVVTLKDGESQELLPALAIDSDGPFGDDQSSIGGSFSLSDADTISSPDDSSEPATPPTPPTLKKLRFARLRRIYKKVGSKQGA